MWGTDYPYDAEMIPPPAIEVATDDQLVERFCASRDETAFEGIVCRYGPLVLGTARQIIGCEHRAEDVHQAVFMVLARDAKRIRNRNNLAGWLYGVTYRISVRVAKEHSKQVEMHDFEPTSTKDALSTLIERIEKEIVLNELRRLPEKYRTILILKYYRRMTTGEVARTLGLSESAVAGRLKRGRNELRLRLARQGIGFLVLATVFEMMRTETSAASSLLEKTLGICLASDMATHTTNSPKSINELANQESARMFARNVAKSMALSAVVISIMTLGLATWPSDRGRVLAENGETQDVILPSQEVDERSTIVDAVQLQSSVQLTRNQTQEERIAERLAGPTECKFTDVPLSDVLKSLGKHHGVQIVLDVQGLAAEGVTSDTPISIDVSSIRLENALTLMLRPLRLSAVTTEEVLLVTSRENADEYTTTTNVYPIDDQLQNAGELVEIIESKVEPSSWDKAGGRGSISSIEGALVVRQARRVHVKLESLLEQLSGIKSN